MELADFASTGQLRSGEGEAIDGDLGALPQAEPLPGL
jgi:hypothetical protein